MPSDFSKWHNDNVNSLQRSYKQKPPPGKTRNVERETGHVLRLEVLFRILNFLLKTIFIYNISARDRPYAQVSNSFSILEFLAQNNFPKAFFVLSNLGTLTSFHYDCHVHSNPGDFLFLDKFTSTGFINKIYNMEVGVSLSESLIPNLQKKKTFLDCLGARRRHLGGDSSKVWNNLDAGDIPPYSRIWDRLT